MTCKDCVHYEICLPNSQAYGHKLKPCTKLKNKADFVEVKHSEWIKPYINRYGHPCHCCGVCGFKASQQDRNYCPNCGADMRKEGADNDS